IHSDPEVLTELTFFLNHARFQVVTAVDKHITPARLNQEIAPIAEAILILLASRDTLNHV
ncbi:unnamed protein product, partial [marine sediment metagenome]